MIKSLSTLSYKLKAMRVFSLLFCVLISNLGYSATKYLYVGETYRMETPSPVSSNGYIDNAALLSTADALAVDTSDPFDVKITVLRYFSNIVTVKVRFVEKYTYNGHIDKVDHDVEVSIGAKYPTVKALNPNMTIKVGETKKLEYEVTPDGLLPPEISWGTANYFGYTENYVSYTNDGHDCWVTGKKKGKCDIIGLPFNQQSMAMAYVITVVEDEQNKKLSLSASPSGGSVESGTKVYLTASADGSTVSGADIYYTTNGSTPSKSSTKYTSSGITINSATTIKAIAYKDGYETSDVGSWSYTIAQKPKLSLSASPSGGSVESGTKVYLSASADGSTVSGADIYFTTNGDTPSKSSTKYTFSGITITESCTLKAIAYKNGYENGTLAEKYTIKISSEDSKKVSLVSAGAYHSMILMADGSLWACGVNDSGQLCDGTMTDKITPVKIMDNVSTVSAGGRSTLIVKRDGQLFACGLNDRGQLGDGTNTDRSTPVKIMDDVSSVSAGGGHSMIIKTDGSLWACGENNWYGKLGTGDDLDNRNVPVKIMDGVKSVSAEGDYTWIVKTDGTLWGCGGDYHYTGDWISRTPYKMMENVEKVSADNCRVMIIKTDGSLWGKGYNSSGQLGDGSTTTQHSFVKILDNVAQVSAGYSHTMIVKKDGSLWACGSGENGQLGDGMSGIGHKRLFPIKVLDDVTSVTAGMWHTLAVKSDGTLWGCGNLDYDLMIDFHQRTTVITTFKKIDIGYKNAEILFPSAGFSTFYDSKSAYTLPSGLSAQVVTNAANNKLTYKTIADGSVLGVIPAGTAVMLVSDNKQSGTYTLTATENSTSYTGANLLRGSDEAQMTTGDGYHYKLSYGMSGTAWSDVFGWYWGADDGGSFMTEGHKAWLVVPKSAATTRGFTVDGDTTGISTLEVSEEEAVYYDLQGRRVMNPTVKGVYIKNGKKVMVK